MSLLWSVLAALQSVAPPGETVVVRLPDGLQVTVAEYREHLHRAIGSARVAELLYDRLLARELHGRDLQALPQAVRDVLADPERAVDRRHREIVATEHGGDRARWLASLRRIGHTEQDARDADRDLLLRDARVTALVMLERVPDERALRRVFEHAYGVDGQRVTVRHVLASFADARRELASAARSRPVDDARVEALARARIERAHEQLAGGAAFEALGAVEVPDYNYQQYGTPFATAVRALAVGAISTPVRSDLGWHLIRVDSRVTTRFEDVRDAVAAQRAGEPASLGEQRALRERLFRQSGADRALAELGLR